MNRLAFNTKIILGLAVITLTVAYFSLPWGQLFPSPKRVQTGTIACTMDAKLCPDGSSVGRVAPRCEFAPCSPSITSPTTKGWKNYVNNTLKFQVKYPSNYFESIEGKAILLKNSENTGVYRLIIIDNPQNLTPLEYINYIKSRENEPESMLVLSLQPIIVNGVQGIDSKQTGPGGYLLRSVYFPAKDKIVKITYALNTVSIDFNNNETAFNKFLADGNTIVSTFLVAI